MEINLLAKSSTKPEEPYEVTFLFTQNKVCVLCNCPAGIWGKLCKHKIQLINNDEKMLFDPEEQPELEKAHALIQNTSLMDVYSKFETRKNEIEKERKKLTKELSDIKNGFGRQLHDGID